MEILIRKNGEIFRIDGMCEENSSFFYGERLDEKLQPTEDYREFRFDDLVKAQADALIQSQTITT